MLCAAAVVLLAAAAGGTAAQGIGSIITQSVFDNMLKQRNNAACPAKGFYTYDAFVTAARTFPALGTTGDLTTRKRELAAFFGETSHETTGLIMHSICELQLERIFNYLFSAIIAYVMVRVSDRVQEERGAVRISSSGDTASRKSRSRRIHPSTDEDPFS